MAPLPPAGKLLIAGTDSPWLPPISFGVEPYLDLCRSLAQELKDLEARFPSHRPMVSLSTRSKQFKRQKKK